MNREQIIRMAREVGWDDHHCQFDTRIERFAALVAQAEREACANVCEDVRADSVSGGGPVEAFNYSAKVCAKSIRARSNT